MVKIKLHLLIHSAGFFYSWMYFAKVGWFHVPRLTSVTLKHKAFCRSYVY